MDMIVAQSALFGAGIFFLILFIVFLILREFFCWYWKINKRQALLEKQCEQNEQIIQLLRQRQDVGPDIPKLIASRN